MTSARGIGFDVRPSATLLRLAVLIVVLATMAPLLTDMAWYVRGALAAAIAALGHGRLASLRRPAVTFVAWTADGIWSVTLAGGKAKRATLVASRVFGTAVFLHLRWRGGAGQLALLADNTPAETLRLLRARLTSQRSP